MRLRKLQDVFTLQYQITCKVWKASIVDSFAAWSLDDAQAEADTQASGPNEKDSNRDDLSQMKDVFVPCLREAIMKRRKYSRQKAKKKAKSAVADLKFYTRSTSNRVKHILQKHLDIG